MKKIRIGKDIHITWGITTNGEPRSLEGRDLKLILITPLRNNIGMKFSVDGNTIACDYHGAEQKYLGIYMLTLWENYGKLDQTAVDACNAFQLVATTCQEGGSNEGLDTETVGLEGSITVGIKGSDGASAYEIAVKNGFQGSVEEWLQSLKQPAEDAASAANIQIEAMKALESTVTQQEQSRQTAERSRVEAENIRQTSEQQRIDTFTALQEDIDTLKREAQSSISNADEATDSANQAATQATQAAQSADTATHNATLAADYAQTAGDSIAQLEQTIEQTEQSRISAEQSRATAENERQEAEKLRVLSEQSRTEAEDIRKQQEQSRQSAEQLRVSEFTALKQESETATENANNAALSANEAAENANQLAENIDSRVKTVEDKASQVYESLEAIQSSGETNPDKIYIDGSDMQPYVYKDGGFVKFKGEIFNGIFQRFYKCSTDSEIAIPIDEDNLADLIVFELRYGTKFKRVRNNSVIWEMQEPIYLRFSDKLINTDIIIHEKYIYARSDPHGIFKINIEDGTYINNRIDVNKVNKIALFNNKIYASDENKLVSLSLDNLELIETIEIPDGKLDQTYTMSVYEDRMLVACRNKLIIIKLDGSYEEIQCENLCSAFMVYQSTYVKKRFYIIIDDIKIRTISEDLVNDYISERNYKISTIGNYFIDCFIHSKSGGWTLLTLLTNRGSFTSILRGNTKIDINETVSSIYRTNCIYRNEGFSNSYIGIFLTSSKSYIVRRNDYMYKQSTMII